MSLVPFKEILADAFNRRYGVGAFNIVNDLTLEAVLQAAEEARWGKHHESADLQLREGSGRCLS